MNLRFDSDFHQSDIKQYLDCPYALSLKRIYEVERTRASVAAMAGTAFHDVVEYAHETGNFDPLSLWPKFLELYNSALEAAVSQGLEIKGTLDEERFFSMLAGYCSKAWNREAVILAAESEFFFTIKPSKTEYKFTGRIDQLVSIPKKLLVPDFPALAAFPQNDIILHRDLKTGQRRGVSPFELALDVQFDVYGLAFAQGLFIDKATGDLKSLPAPDVHVKYFTEDHVPYKSDAGTYLKDANDQYVPCDIVETPCLLGKRNTPCLGKRKFCTKQSRGPGMYFTVRTPRRLAELPKELGTVCASMRMGYYPRRKGDLCFGYCGYRELCEAQVLDPGTTIDQLFVPQSSIMGK